MSLEVSNAQLLLGAATSKPSGTSSREPRLSPPPPQQQQEAASFAEAAEVLASLASSVLPIGTSVASSSSSQRNGTKKKNGGAAAAPEELLHRKRSASSSHDSYKAKKTSGGRQKKRATPSPAKPHPSSSSSSSPKTKKKLIPPGHPAPAAEHPPPNYRAAAAAAAVAEGTSSSSSPGQQPPIMLSAMLAAADNKALDEASRLSLQREVAGIRRRYDDSGDLESLLREARDVDARLKRTGFQVRRDDLLLTVPNVSQIPQDHPLLPTLMAAMAASAQVPAPVAAAAVAAMNPIVDDDSSSKLARALLSSQQQLLPPDIGAAAMASPDSLPMSLPPLSQMNDVQLQLLRQLWLRHQQQQQQQQQEEQLVGFADHGSDRTSLQGQDGVQRDVLNMLLLRRLQQQDDNSSSVERNPLLDQLAPLLLNSGAFSIGEQNLAQQQQQQQQNPQSRLLEQLSMLLQEKKAASTASDAFPFLASNPPAGLSTFGGSTSSSLGLERQVRDLESSLTQEREASLLQLIRQAQLLRQQQEPASPTLGSSFPLPGVVDASSDPNPLVHLLKAQLLAKQQAEQASSEQDRVLSILQALQESRQQPPVKAAAPTEQEQILELMLKAQRQGQPSSLPSVASAQELLPSTPAAALVRLAQLQASLQQQKALEEEAAAEAAANAAAAAAQASLFQGLAQLVNGGPSVGLGASESLSSQPQQQVQLLAMLRAIQEQQR